MDFITEWNSIENLNVLQFNVILNGFQFHVCNTIDFIGAQWITMQFKVIELNGILLDAIEFY